MTRDEQIRELHRRAGSWHPLALIYGILFVCLVVTGMSIT